MVDVPYRRENLSYGENRAIFYQPVQELWHFSKNPRGRTFFENLKVFPTIDFWRFFWTCSGGVVEHVLEEKCRHLIFSFSRPNLTVPVIL